MPPMTKIQGFSAVKQSTNDTRWQTQTVYSNSKGQRFELTLLAPDQNRLKDYSASFKGYVQLLPVPQNPPDQIDWPMFVAIQMQIRVLDPKVQTSPCLLQAKFATEANDFYNLSSPFKLSVNDSFDNFVGNFPLYVEAPPLPDQVPQSISRGDEHIWLFSTGATNSIRAKLLGSGGVGNVNVELLYLSNYSNSKNSWANGRAEVAYQFGTLTASQDYSFRWGINRRGEVVGDYGWYALKITTNSPNPATYQLNIAASQLR
jgi:hypothetical protein